MSNNEIMKFSYFYWKRPYFTMESAMTVILRDACGKMHHGILFDRRLRQNKPFLITLFGPRPQKRKIADSLVKETNTLIYRHTMLFYYCYCCHSSSSSSSSSYYYYYYRFVKLEKETESLQQDNVNLKGELEKW